jgi:hypothetical protein
MMNNVLQRFPRIERVTDALLRNLDQQRLDPPREAGIEVGWSAIGAGIGSFTWRMRIATGVSESLKAGVPRMSLPARARPQPQCKTRKTAAPPPRSAR